MKGIPFVIIGVFKQRVDTFGQSEISDQTLLIPYPVARYFTGKYERRVIPCVGHDVPQEAPMETAKATLDLLKA